MTRHRLDPDRSRVVIEARSSVHPIRTETTGLTGWIELGGPDGLGHVELAVSRLRSGNPLEDAELRRRVDARRYPTIIGDVEAMEDLGDGRWLVTGAVTCRGVTRRYEETITMEVSEGGELHITGSATFDVRDFGIEPPRVLMLRVSPDVRVAIDVIAEPGT